MDRLEDIYGKLREKAQTLFDLGDTVIGIPAVELRVAQAATLELAEAVLDAAVDQAVWHLPAGNCQGAPGCEFCEDMDAIRQRLRALAAPEAGEWQRDQEDANFAADLIEGKA